MGTKQKSSNDVFSQSTCSICGNCEVNQFFEINKNFINYCGIYISLKEILAEALDLQIDCKNDEATEICLDCKDKVIKFYHFKRKAKGLDESSKRFRGHKSKSQVKERRSKIVHNIYQIIEDYTEKCSISTIKVDQNNKKLIIESNDGNDDEEDEEDDDESNENEKDIFAECERNIVPNNMIIKEEPFDASETVIFSNLEEETFNEGYSSSETEVDEKDDDSSFSHLYAPPSTSKKVSKAKKKKIDKTELEGIMLPVNPKEVKIPVSNELQLRKLAALIDSNVEYEKSLGIKVMRSTRHFYNEKFKNYRTVIRAIMKTLISVDLCSNINMTGRSSKLLNGNATKMPEQIVEFLIRYTSIISSTEEKVIREEVKIVIKRLISDDRNYKKKQEMRKAQRAEKAARLSNILHPTNSNSDDLLKTVVKIEKT